MLVLLGLLAPAGAAAAYLDELVARSRELRLSERTEWHRLLHYAPNLLRPGVRSLADAPAFFLAPDGKTDPRGELEATLAAFFSDVQETDKVQNPQCAFIARFTWLDAQLGFDPARMPRQPCRRYREWHEALNPQGVTLVFPVAYINNPSSMYGHTLLRIDAKDQTEKTRLLAYAINWTANTSETNGALFAINALFGVYPGVYSILPYYIKVREYSDLENRDIWEYELNLTPAEIERMLMHIWELTPVWFDYWFFDENCAYYILAALEVARPDLDLTGPFRWWAIPSDTVRTVVAQPGLLRRAAYRPSNATLLRHRLGAMDAAERSLVERLGRGRVAPDDPAVAALPAPERARVLEVSHDYLNYLRASGEPPVKEPAALARTLLLERARVGAEANDPPVPVPAVRPDQGHGTSRLALGAGRRDGVNFVELRARPSYHDRMDPEEGYARGAEIEFLDFAVRDYGKDIGVRLEDIRPVNIVSISPRSDFFRPLSWNVDFGWTRRRLADGSEPLIFGVHGGAGLARTVPDALTSNPMVYAFIDSTLQASSKLEKGYSLGAGPALGMLADLTARWRLEPFAYAQRFFAGDTDTAWSTGLRQRYTLATDFALRLDAWRERQGGHAWNTVLGSLHWYF